ncbi:MAG: HlyC/CorC family transporter [Saprospiraceae bacterium]|nr:HlyC/CorC family transporter [Saprospiraceae bacterium]
MLTFSFLLLFLLLSALFSGTEIAFLSANKLIVELKRKKGSRRGSIISRFYEKPSEFLGTMLVGNNIALVVFTSLMAMPLKRLFQEQMGIASEGLLLLISTTVITLIILLFGEFLPKTLFRLYADEILYLLAYPLRVIKFILALPAWLMTKLSNFLLIYLLKSPIEEVQDVFTRLDLENFIKSTRTETNDEIDTELFEKALNLREVRVKECMVPRPEIEAIDVGASIDELIHMFKNSNLSRILVYQDDIDHVLGYIHHQQMLKEPPSIGKCYLDIPIVPETMRVRDLMNQFIKNRLNIACVVDEYGGTAGVITLEDILEEIFGEIEDEHDTEDYVEKQLSDTEFIFSGRLEIGYLNERYPLLQFPEGEYHTLSGYLVMTTANIPSQGDEIVLGQNKFVLEMVSDTKIETVRVIRLTDEESR